MKTLKLLATGALLFSFVVSTGQNASANRVPSWGSPISSERYYYIPDIQSYYDIPSREYIYLNNGDWVRSRELPLKYKSYDLQGGRKIAINDYHGNAPYTYYNVHQVKYPRSDWENVRRESETSSRQRATTSRPGRRDVSTTTRPQRSPTAVKRETSISPPSQQSAKYKKVHKHNAGRHKGQGNAYRHSKGKGHAKH